MGGRFPYNSAVMDGGGGAFELGTDGPKVILVGVDDSVTSLRAGAYGAGVARPRAAARTPSGPANGRSARPLRTCAGGPRRRPNGWDSTLPSWRPAGIRI